MPAISMEKAPFRAFLRARLREKSPRDASGLCARVARLLDSLATDCLVGYLAFQQEPKLDTLLENWLMHGKRLVLPRFHHASRQYELVAVSDWSSQLRTGHYGIREPIPELTEIKELNENSAWLVPGLGFTSSGIRLGRGAGYYDRLFAHYPQGIRIGIAWEMQLLPELPRESWDIPMDYVVSEAHTYVGASSHKAI